MTKEQIIKYIRASDVFFNDAHLENYPYHELMLIKISIDVEKSKEVDFKPMASIPHAVRRKFSGDVKRLQFTSEENE